MDVNEPGLFEMPAREPAASPERLQRGRNRETWVRTVAAEVNIIDADALRDAALRVEESGLTIALGAGLDVQDTGAEADVEAVGDTFEKLAWLIWPTDGMEEPLAAGAFIILSVDSAAVAESDDRGILTWTVMVKLTDVQELRRLAAQAHPEEAGLIAASMAVAWQRAADPFVPVRSVPGIAWRPARLRSITCPGEHGQATRIPPDPARHRGQGALKDRQRPFCIAYRAAGVVDGVLPAPTSRVATERTAGARCGRTRLGR